MNKLNLLAAAPLALILALCGCGDGAPTETEATSKAAATAAPKAEPPEGKAWHEVVTVTPEGGYAMGNPDAPTTLIEYGAVTCSHCAAFEQAGFAPLQKEFVDSGKVRFELRNFLLTPFDIPITLLTRCNGPEDYFPLTEQVFEQQAELMAPAIKLSDSDPQAMQDALNGPADERIYQLGKVMGVMDFFKDHGISEDKARTCLNDQKAIEQLIGETKTAIQQKKISGTPTFFLNGEKIETDKWDELRPHLIAAGAR